MTNQHRPPLLALSALLLCALGQQTGGSSASASSPSAVRGRDAVNHSHELRAAATIQEKTGHVVRPALPPVPSPDEGGSSVCAYRVVEGGIWGQLCFRHTLFGYQCLKEDCRRQVSQEGLVANVLINGSVLLQWSPEGDTENRDKETLDSGSNSTRSNTVSGERRHRRSGYELSCWWNGSYTQFECASVHLGSGCRDFLLSDLHENIPYRICLRSLLARSDLDQGAERRRCVEFTLPPSGMQDIVIAMTTVGGAICVMLVIICLLVAYITENLMSPTTQHAYSYRTHSRH